MPLLQVGLEACYHPYKWTYVCVIVPEVQRGIGKSTAGIFVFLQGYFWLSQCGGERLCYWHLAGKSDVI